MHLEEQVLERVLEHHGGPRHGHQAVPERFFIGVGTSINHLKPLARTLGPLIESKEYGDVLPPEGTLCGQIANKFKSRPRFHSKQLMGQVCLLLYRAHYRSKGA